MMQRKSLSFAAASSFAALFAATAASAQCLPCRPVYEPGMLEYMVGLFTAPGIAACVRCGPAYQHDYVVNQGPVYSGPALILPQPTYAPTPAAVGYPYVAGYPFEADERVVVVPVPARRVIYRK